MRTTLHIDSATTDEMRDALLAWHFTDDMFLPPQLALDGLVVKVCGSAFTIESPPIHPTRAQMILDAVMSKRSLRELGDEYDRRRQENKMKERAA